MSLIDLVLVILGPAFTVLLIAHIAREAPDREAVADLKTWALLNDPPPTHDGDPLVDSD